MTLAGLSTIVSPKLLYTVARMGHGDIICFADANFPSESLQRENGSGPEVIRADGHRVVPLLKAIVGMFPLDKYAAHPVCMMTAVPGDTLDPAVEEGFKNAIDASQPGMFKLERLERFAFYERATTAFAVVATGDTAKYGNIMITKGVLDARLTDAGEEIFMLPTQ